MKKKSYIANEANLSFITLLYLSAQKYQIGKKMRVLTFNLSPVEMFFFPTCLFPDSFFSLVTPLFRFVSKGTSISVKHMDYNIDIKNKHLCKCRKFKHHLG